MVAMSPGYSELPWKGDTNAKKKKAEHVELYWGHINFDEEEDTWKLTPIINAFYNLVKLYAIFKGYVTFKKE